MRFLKSFLFLFIFIPGLLYGAPCYGPNMPQEKSWDVGAEVNILLEREMEKAYGEFESSQYFIT
jgi:hypothetical protein